MSNIHLLANHIIEHKAHSYHGRTHHTCITLPWTHTPHMYNLISLKKSITEWSSTVNIEMLWDEHIEPMESYTRATYNKGHTELINFCNMFQCDKSGNKLFTKIIRFKQCMSGRVCNYYAP